MSTLPPGIDRLPSGKIRARYRDESGRQHSQTFPERGGIRAAQAWLREQRTAVDNGVHVAPNQRITVAEFIEAWYKARPYGARGERQSANYLRHVVESGLGARPMRLVRTTEVQAFVTGRSKAGLAPQTVRNLYTWVKAAFASAVEDRVIGASPCTKRIVLPRVEKPKVIPLTVDQVRDLADAAGDRYRIGVLLQAALGLRISEVLGLRVEDVDFLRRIVHVRHQLAPDGRGFAPLKYESEREVPLARDLVPVLSQHLATYPPNHWRTILTTTRGNPIRSDYYSDRMFKPAVLAAATVPDDTTSHDLRHHFASVLLAERVPTNVVAEYLGHSSSRLVETTYGHLMPDAGEVTRSALDGVWGAERVTRVSRGSLTGL